MTSEYIKEAYEKLKIKLGKQPSKTEFFESTTVTETGLFRGGFRTFSQLVEEMGDTPKSFGQDAVSEEDFLISYGNVIRKHKGIPSTADWKFHQYKPALTSYLRKFKLVSWKDFALKFYDYAKDKEEWKDIIEFVPKIENSTSKVQERENDECYVYLMYDTKTFCHKIGISNLPEWREKTLQSQKPSIKLVASKKYINRRIAANIEKALHESYSHKRKRGEWFELDTEDIEEIKETLKS